MVDADAVVGAAVILAGGAGRRLGGPAKPTLDVAGRSLLDRVLDACAAVPRRVVVGPARDLPAGVRATREEPPGGGPVPALRAGLALLPPGPGRVAVLAADLPFLLPADLDRLGAALLAGGEEAVGAVFVDEAGREQWLAGVWRLPVLRAALAAYDGDSLRGLLRPLRPRPVTASTTDRPAPWLDCDTPADLERARAAVSPAGRRPARPPGAGRARPGTS